MVGSWASWDTAPEASNDWGRGPSNNKPVGGTGGGGGGSWSGGDPAAPVGAVTPGTAPYRPPATISPFQQQGAQQTATAFYGPQSDLLSDQLARQMWGENLANPYSIGTQANLGRSNLQRDTALGRQGLGLDRQALGLQKENVGADKALNKTQQANLAKLRGILGKQYGLQGEQFANQLAGLNISETEARDMAKRSIWDLRSNLTSRGAYNTVANERGTGRVNRSLDYTIGGINNQRTGADIQNRGAVLGLNEKGIGYDNQGAALSANAKQLSTKMSSLGIDAARIGLSEQQLTNALTDGINAIGMGEYMDLGSLLDAKTSTNIAQADMAGKIAEMAAGFIQNPQIAAMFRAAMGLSSPGMNLNQRTAAPGSRAPL